jgi:hypothetical protein
VSAALTLTIFGCAPYAANEHLGVLPPAPPKPLWLGSTQPPVDSALRGAAAVTPSATPNWSHVIVSLAGARPSATYSWTVNSGRCSDNGAVVGTADRYAPLVAFADGTATSEAVIPVMLTPSSPYSVHFAPGVCAELVYGTM